MDHSRDPCPWVILNDFGGAFAMGVSVSAHICSPHMLTKHPGSRWCGMAWCQRGMCLQSTRRCSPRPVLTRSCSFVTLPMANDALAPSQLSKPAPPYSVATLASGEASSTHTTARSRAYGRRRTHGMPSSQDSSLVARSRYEGAIDRCAMAPYHVPFCWPSSRAYRSASTA
jgi:hypothetical protein